MTNPDREELVKLADFDHRCSDEECVNFGQRTFSNNCKCHKTREQMMLEEIRSLRTLASRQAEPVAWRWRYDGEYAWSLRKDRPSHADDRDVICEPLYTAPPQSASDGALRESDQAGWLIEKDDPPVYHVVTDDHDAHWTADASKALRFARREDAQAYSDHIGWTSPPVRVVEHMWPASEATKSDGGPAHDRKH